MKILFVTSLPRCGSTWLAQGLAALGDRRYVHEPFNWKKHPERKAYAMRYLTSDAGDLAFSRILKQSVRPDTLAGRLRVLLAGGDVVLKDVHSCLAVEYVDKVLHPAVVILTRHPCGMASSWKALRYRVDFRVDGLLSQSRLMEEHLAPFEAHLRSDNEYFFQLGAYWAAAYYVLHRLRSKHPEWQFVEHERLCADPHTAFRSVLTTAGVDPCGAGERFFEEHDRRPNAGESTYAPTRITRAEPEKWKRLLTAEEIAAVYHGAEPFGLRLPMPG